MESEFSPSTIIWVLVAAFIFFSIVKANKKDKSIMLKGEPYLGLKIEWPAYSTGSIIIENDIKIGFPNDFKDENILNSRQRGHEQKLYYVFPDQTWLSHDEIKLNVQYRAQNTPPNAELEIELAIFFIESKDRYTARELEEFETNVNGNAKNDIVFSNIQKKLERYKKIYQNNEPQKHDDNTVQR